MGRGKDERRRREGPERSEREAVEESGDRVRIFVGESWDERQSRKKGSSVGEGGGRGGGVCELDDQGQKTGGGGGIWSEYVGAPFRGKNFSFCKIVGRGGRRGGKERGEEEERTRINWSPMGTCKGRGRKEAAEGGGKGVGSLRRTDRWRTGVYLGVRGRKLRSDKRGRRDQK
jgi:hypothetical protein